MNWFVWMARRQVLLMGGAVAGLLGCASPSYQHAMEIMPPLPSYAPWDCRAASTSVCAVAPKEGMPAEFSKTPVVGELEMAIGRTGHKVLRRNGDIKMGRYFVTRADRLTVKQLVTYDIKQDAAYQGSFDVGYIVTIELVVYNYNGMLELGRVEVQGRGRADWLDHAVDAPEDYAAQVRLAQKLGRAAGIAKPSVACIALPVAKERAVIDAFRNAAKYKLFVDLLDNEG